MVATHRTRLTDLSAGAGTCAPGAYGCAPGHAMQRGAAGGAGAGPAIAAGARDTVDRSHGTALACTRDRERAVASAARAGLPGDDRRDRALGVLDPRGA